MTTAATTTSIRRIVRPPLSLSLVSDMDEDPTTPALTTQIDVGVMTGERPRFLIGALQADGVSPSELRGMLALDQQRVGIVPRSADAGDRVRWRPSASRVTGRRRGHLPSVR